jgi:hypothetical protein
MSVTCTGLSLASKFSANNAASCAIPNTLVLLHSKHVVGPHHFIVFMFQNVAVPNVPASVALEPRNDPRHHTRMRLHGVFPTGFVQRWRHSCAHVLDSASLVVVLRLKGPAVEDLKSDQVEVNRMRVIRKVQQVPDLDGI